MKILLKEMIHVMSHKVLNQKTWHEQLFFTMDWQNQKNIDSYGYDFEFSWLLVEAADVLDDEEILKDAQCIAVNLVAVQLKEGIDENGAMMYEKEDDHLNANLEWYRSVTPDGTPQKNRAKADHWRCPYHNSRMGFEVMTRFSEI